jgi:hypothetical protein
MLKSIRVRGMIKARAMIKGQGMVRVRRKE